MAPWNISIAREIPCPVSLSPSDNFTHGTILDIPRKTYEYWFENGTNSCSFSLFFFFTRDFYQKSYRRRKLPQRGGRRILDLVEKPRGKIEVSEGGNEKRVEIEGEVNDLLRRRG